MYQFKIKSSFDPTVTLFDSGNCLFYESGFVSKQEADTEGTSFMAKKNLSEDEFYVVPYPMVNSEGSIQTDQQEEIPQEVFDSVLEQEETLRTEIETAALQDIANFEQEIDEMSNDPNFWQELYDGSKQNQ